MFLIHRQYLNSRCKSTEQKFRTQHLHDYGYHKSSTKIGFITYVLDIQSPIMGCGCTIANYPSELNKYKTKIDIKPHKKKHFEIETEICSDGMDLVSNSVIDEQPVTMKSMKAKEVSN